MLVNLECLPERPTVYRNIINSPWTAGYHITFMFKDLKILSSGTGMSEDLAARKAYSEACERIFYQSSKTDRAKWKFDSLNTTDCMACGFDLSLTMIRSNFESVERYLKLLLSDGRLKLMKIGDTSHSGMIRYCLDYFNNPALYVCRVLYYNYERRPVEAFFSLATSIVGERFISGSSVSANLKASQEHACIELFRNNFIYQKMNEEPYASFQDIYLKKCYKSALMKDRAIEQLILSMVDSLPTVHLPFIDWQISTRVYNAYICRSFLHGYLDYEVEESFQF